MPEAFIWITTSPGPGAGSGKVRISIFLLPRNTAPRMAILLVGPCFELAPVPAPFDLVEKVGAARLPAEHAARLVGADAAVAAERKPGRLRAPFRDRRVDVPALRGSFPAEQACDGFDDGFEARLAVLDEVERPGARPFERQP